MLFRAHHNKVFFEILRAQSPLEALNRCQSKVFGTYEDFLKSDYKSWIFPKVIKASAGSGSKSVFLAKSAKVLKRKAWRLSCSFSLFDAVRFYGKKILRRGYIPESLNRRKFLIQDFISGLDYDYKVLVYGHRYYVLKRKVRNNDFRASGSGHFSFPSEPPELILTTAKKIYNYFNVPFISLDLAETSEEVLVIEAQFLMFGTYTQMNSNWFFVNTNNTWHRINEKLKLEDVFSDALINFISSKK